jgi:hypothetical protein
VKPVSEWTDDELNQILDDPVTEVLEGVLAAEVLRLRAACADYAAIAEQNGRELYKAEARAERLERIEARWFEENRRADDAEAEVARYRAGAEGARLDRWMAREAELLGELAEARAELAELQWRIDGLEK